MCASNVEAFANGEPGNIDMETGAPRAHGVSAENLFWSNNTQKMAGAGVAERK